MLCEIPVLFSELWMGTWVRDLASRNMRRCGNPFSSPESDMSDKHTSLSAQHVLLHDSYFNRPTRILVWRKELELGRICTKIPRWYKSPYMKNSAWAFTGFVDKGIRAFFHKHLLTFPYTLASRPFKIVFLREKRIATQIIFFLVE